MYYTPGLRTPARYTAAVRAPPRTPSLTAQCVNARCKKTYRALQRTDPRACVVAVAL